MTQAEHPSISEFTQKMSDEGSAGFADGPWDETELADDSKLSAKQRRKKNWAMNSRRRAKQRTLGDRVLTWVTILTLITLIAGVGGTWLSYQPEPEITVTRTDRLNKTPSLERVESRLTRMERRLSHILDPYIRMLNNLSGELDDTQKQLIEHIQDTGQLQATTTTGIEDRLEHVEQRLAVADERMDTLSTMLVALVDGKPGSVPGTGQSAPRATPATTEATVAVAATQTPEVTESSGGATPAPTELEMPVLTAQQPAPTVPTGSQTNSTGKPAATAIEPAPEPNPETPVLAAQQPAPTVPTGSQTDSTGKPAATTVEPAPDPVPEIPVLVAPQPAAVELAASQAESAVQPVKTAPEPVPEIKQEPAVPAAAGTASGTVSGDWVINIASYTNERIARRKLAQMQQQGVDVELVTAEVNGKTIYRARVFGFASRRDAASAAVEIKSKLGLEEAWITKR